MIELCYEYFSVWCIWLYVLVMSRMHFRVNPHSIVAWMSKNSLLETGMKSEVLSDCNGTRTHNHLLCKRKLSHLVKWLWIWVPLQSLKTCNILMYIFLIKKKGKKKNYQYIYNFLEHVQQYKTFWRINKCNSTNYWNKLNTSRKKLQTHALSLLIKKQNFNVIKP